MTMVRSLCPSCHPRMVANARRFISIAGMHHFLMIYRFTPLLAGAYSGLVPVVGVPSRLYSTPSPEMPLGGLRFSVKDNYQFAGISTTMGSRSYTKLYGPQTKTSALVKRIVDLGGIIVGKTKMGAFAGSEVPSEKCIDYFPPWNPRGDG